MRRLFFGAVVSAGLVACAGTRDAREPGEKLGTFHVTGKLVATSCGKALDPWRFDVRLSREGSTLYWIQGALPIAGKLDAQSRVRLDARAEAVVEKKDPRRGIEGCTMRRIDALDATLTGEPPTGFEASLVYRFEMASGDCSTQLSMAGGEYDVLPCTMTYALSAERAQTPAPAR